MHRSSRRNISWRRSTEVGAGAGAAEGKRVATETTAADGLDVGLDQFFALIQHVVYDALGNPCFSRYTISEGARL